MTRSAIFDSPVGPLDARFDDDILTQLGFSRSARQVTPGGDFESFAPAKMLRAQITEYFEGRRKRFDLSFRLDGPSFHRIVWEALCEIPYGETMSYGQLANRIGEPDAARAVGAANGANPIVIIVPCHRVIGADGKLVGYGGGLKRKRTLLDLESGRVVLPI